MKDDVGFTYPLKWNSLDGVSVLSLGDAADVEAFYIAFFDATRAVEDSGTVLKDAIRAAADQAALDAVVDTR